MWRGGFCGIYCQFLLHALIWCPDVEGGILWNILSVFASCFDLVLEGLRARSLCGHACQRTGF